MQCPENKRQADVIDSPAAKRGRGRGHGHAAVGLDVVNVNGQPEPGPTAIVDADVNPNHSVAEAATSKRAQEVVNEAIQAKRFIMSKEEFQGVGLLQSAPCNCLHQPCC